MSARSHGDDLSLTGSQISTRSSLKKSSSARQLNRASSATGPRTPQTVVLYSCERERERERERDNNRKT